VPQTVLVTGGAGYVGSHAAKALAAAGYRPVTVDNLSRGHAWAVRWGPLERGDLLDRSFLDAAFGRWRPTAVLHLAAFAYVGESVGAPALYYRNNVVGSLQLLEAMRDHGVTRLVFSSTCATYGTPDEVPIAEDAPQRPINPYGNSKLVVEAMLRDFDAAHGLRSVALRYFNAAGADAAAETGEDHDPETHLIPVALAVAAGRRPRLDVFGDDYPTADGTCIRDYVHVTDLAAAHVLALRALTDGATTMALNLGTGTGASVREVIRTVEQVTERRVPIRIVDRRPGDPPVLVAAPGRARGELGWQPQHSRLETIVRTAWVWFNTARPTENLSRSGAT
jgi:UDP-arabinose 4-epimerase